MSDFDRSRLPDFAPYAQMGWTARGYVELHLNVTNALLFTDVLQPDLIEVEGCVLLSENYEETNFREWFKRFNGDTEAVEGMINHLSMWDLLSPTIQLEYEALESLAPRVARSWQLHASEIFPHREFVGEVYEEYGPTVTLTSRLRD